MTTAGVLLAAGQSLRFGDDDKLLATYQGRPLVAYAADAMRRANVDLRFAVVSNRAVEAELAGFELVAPPDDEISLSASLRAGIRAADRAGADRVLVVLGDMPGISHDHLDELLNRCSQGTPSATRGDAGPGVPACFPRSSFTRLTGLEGDVGARSLLENLPDESVVQMHADALIDIDYHDQLRIKRVV